ncbi:GNAT family N-acetyltransferase [Mangrovivirga cuniculi]|uniref:GNAT family N-acetyltransferase n=1 Tax=Mangrovivirga cuniculi TaxID=2715131 RepID=A0A4D7JSJ9_9BACT|nr:GNAT family protein [Mangrovivirga cuniculi]QCK15662.1 GNAT family N-acetyltransferase [Mangrovivirga cuniculi]
MIQTENYIIDNIKSDDIKNIHKGLSDPRVIKYYGVSYETLVETQEQMKWYEDLEANGTGKWWAIRNSISNKFVGAAGFNNHEKEHKKAEIGFWLLPEYWNKGIMSEVLPLVIKNAQSDLDIHRIEAYVEDGNESSARLLKRLNFKKEGTLYHSEIKNGKFIDVHIYALIS